MAVTAIMLGYLLLVANRDDTGASRNSDIGRGAAGAALETNTDAQGQVTVQVTPRAFGEERWKFDVVLDTHSVDLDYDMTAVAALSDGGGTAYKPVAWEGAVPGGHHREGVLVFAPIDPIPPSVTLTIRGVGGVSERSFTWNTQ